MLYLLRKKSLKITWFFYHSQWSTPLNAFELIQYIFYIFYNIDGLFFFFFF